MLLFQRPSRSQQAATGVRRMMLASCEVTQGVVEVMIVKKALFLRNKV